MLKQNTVGVDFRYLILNENDRKYPLRVNTVGYQSIEKGHSYPLKEHPSGYYFNADKGRILHEFQLVYITEGEGTFSSMDCSNIKISKGSLIILFPGQWHTYRPDTSTGWTEYYIGFEGNGADDLLRNGFISHENPILNVGVNEELVNLYRRAIEISKSDKIASQQYLGGIVFHMISLGLFSSKNTCFEAKKMDQKIEQAKIIMNDNVFGDIDPQELAESMNLSYSWFRKVFKEYTGYAPAQYYQELKFKKAKELLVNTTSSVKEISFQLNYNSVEHFFSMFKKRTGFTPMEYRHFGRGQEPHKIKRAEMAE